jgi:hypothetical protein
VQWLLIGIGARVLMVFFHVFIDTNGLKGLHPLSNQWYYLAGTDGYIQLAHTIWFSGEYAYAAGEFPVHTRPPVYPILLMLFAGWNICCWYWGAYLLALICYIINHYLVLQIMRSGAVKAGVVATNVAIIGLAIHPYLVASVRAVTFLPVATLLLTAYVYVLIELKATDFRFSWLFYSAIVTILAALTHGTLIVLFVIAAVYIAIQRQYKAFILFVGLVCGGIGGWTYRNYVVFNEFIPIVTGAGMQYWKGDESVFGVWDSPQQQYMAATGKQLLVSFFGAVYPADDRLLWQLAIADMRARPDRLLWRIIKGGFQFWAPGERGYWKVLVAMLLNYPVLILAGRAGYRRYKHKIASGLPVGLLVSIVIAFWAVFAFFAAEAAYCVMLLPILWLIIAAGIKNNIKDY